MEWLEQGKNYWGYCLPWQNKTVSHKRLWKCYATQLRCHDYKSFWSATHTGLFFPGLFSCIFGSNHSMIKYECNNLCLLMQISGTAMVLDEIINHVQALQRQVEVISCLLHIVLESIYLKRILVYCPVRYGLILMNLNPYKLLTCWYTKTLYTRWLSIQKKKL